MTDQDRSLDVVVVGAGMAGLYLLHKLRRLGLNALVVEAGTDVGGTWYWNRYPGARCDIPTTDYAYSFDAELESEWTWSEKYATQPEILAYLRHVAERYDLRRDIRFETRVESASWDADAERWEVQTADGGVLQPRWFIMATGCLSQPKSADVTGSERFAGPSWFTSTWPHEGVDFTGRRVAVIGTGSSGIQSIPLIAEQAAQVTVFQRTPNFSIPARNGPPPADSLAALAEDRDAYRESARWSRIGVPLDLTDISGLVATEEVARARFDQAWEAGALGAVLNIFSDQALHETANDRIAEKIREHIRSQVDDPVVAEKLCPTSFPFGTKRPCLDTGYYATFNRPNVHLVDLLEEPIATITETGVDTVASSYEVDDIVYATGFDAMTGALLAVDIRGRDGLSLRDEWAAGPHTYLGLTAVGFPNLFMITGPGSPSVLSNMAVSIQQHTEWVTDCLDHLQARGFTTIEPTPLAQKGWDRHNADCAAITLMPRAASWYMGANVPGKPRVFLPYVGGVDVYRAACNEVVDRGYLGFELAGPDGRQCNDGEIRQMQPDVAFVLQFLADQGFPALEELSVADARATMEGLAAQTLPGPATGEEVDGTLPGPAGPLDYRLYRPPTPGPHPVMVWFHGGGWVLGSQVSDEPACRDLCVRTDAIVVSVNYRHAPEHRFPAAPDDAFAALQWVGDHAAELGGIPGQLVVAGWSAGANLAAVAAQRARDAGGPALLGQVLFHPVTDSDLTRPSYVDNADGYVLTTGLMRWFWDYYADEADRTSPLAAPIRGDLHGLPPAVVVTADFDPLRDEGDAYADALSAAGVPVHHLRARGHTHTSTTMVDLVVSGAPVRAEVADAIKGFFPATAPAPA